METHAGNIGKVPEKLKKMRGVEPKEAINFTETLVGKFSGANVLEGFRLNAEKLCGARNDTSDFDNEFYKTCLEDNMIIFDFTEKQNDIIIPKMEMSDLENIIFKKLKTGKASDVYRLTVEHLRNCGPAALDHVLTILNLILDDINYVSCPELKTAVGSIIYKGKKKDPNHHKSYRNVRVTPLLGRILDEYIRPTVVAIARPHQSEDQYGFTSDMSYLMGAVQRYECEQHAIDTKKTMFACTLDGDSAFEVVDRDIQRRELFFTGQEGEYWQYSSNSFNPRKTWVCEYLERPGGWQIPPTLWIFNLEALNGLISYVVCSLVHI